MLKCPFCHFDNEDGALFCDQCKSDLSSVVPTTSAPPIVAVPVIPVPVSAVPIVVEAIPVMAEPIDVIPLAADPVYPNLSLGGTATPVVVEAIPVMAEPIPVLAEPIPVLAEPVPVLAEPMTVTPVLLEPYEPIPVTPVPVVATPVPVPAPPAPPPPVPTAPAPAVPATPAGQLPPGAQPRLLVMRGVKRNVEYPVFEGPNFVGRSDDKPVDIDLEEQEPPDRVWCSRQHCCIFFENNELSVEDLNSSNGTFVNRVRIYPGQKTPLKEGDVVQIGNVQMKVVV